MVAVLDPAVPGGTDGGEILVAQADDRLALLHGGGLDHAHGIGQHVVDIGAIGGHHGGGGHDPLEVVHGVDHQDHVTDISRLTVGVHRHQGQQIPNGGGGQVGHGNGGLNGVHAAGNGHIVAHLPVHADGLSVAVARHDTGLQAVGVSLVEHLPHKVVQPLGAKVQHGLAHGHKGGQL